MSGAGRSTPSPRGVTQRSIKVETQRTAGGYVVANGVDRRTADELKTTYPSVVVSRNLDGTYRVTRGR